MAIPVPAPTPQPPPSAALPVNPEQLVDPGPYANQGCFLGATAVCSGSGSLPPINITSPTSGGSATLNPPAPSNPLGGLWIRPNNGDPFKVGDTIRFAANAYGGNGVDHVNFTIRPNINEPHDWFTACTAYRPGGSDVFTCDWQIPGSIALGTAQIGFDVYTTTDHKNSPNDLRSVHLVAANATSTISTNAIKAPSPFKSQWKLTNGCGNCGPASIASALGHYGLDYTTDYVSSQIRGDNLCTVNDPACQNTSCPNADTNFRDSGPVNFLSSKGFRLEPVSSIDDLKNELDMGRPVLMLVLNDYYVTKDTPYPGGNSGYSRLSDGTLIRHIVLVTGYDDQNIYINDPLAIHMENGSYVADPTVGTNFAVPITTFQKAARDAAVTNSGNQLPAWSGPIDWFGDAVAQ